MIEETTEMNDWLKIPSEIAVSMGISMEEAKQYILREHPKTPLAERLRQDWNFEEKMEGSK